MAVANADSEGAQDASATNRMIEVIKKQIFLDYFGTFPGYSRRLPIKSSGYYKPMNKGDPGLCQ
jgi:hypothetical protein